LIRRWLRTQRLGAAVGLLAAAGCELAEVSTPEGRDIVVVEAALRAFEAEQQILLHRTLRGRTVQGEADAQVVVRTSTGRIIRFAYDPVRSCVQVDSSYLSGEKPLDVQVSCYRSAEVDGVWVLPGEAYELRVDTRDGRVIRGRTQVPGDFALLGLEPVQMEGRVPSTRCTLPPRTLLPVHWSSSRGAWAYLTEMEVYGLPQALHGHGIDGVPDPLKLYGVTVSETDTSTVVPKNVGVFERWSYPRALLLAIQNGLPAGTSMKFTVAAMDRNLVNSLRGNSFHPSGATCISTVVGDGVGMFGSMVPLILDVEVTERGDSPPCPT
jgi:hypothetical protein